jgi:SAM-dependent methyltransferase
MSSKINMNTNQIYYLRNRKNIKEIPIKWKEMVYTSKSFNNYAKSPDFQGWSGELQDDLKETKIVLDQLKLRQGNSLLDVACGYGRTSILFASNHGLKVTGIDISPGLIEIAKKTALKRGLDIEYILGDPVHAPWHDGFNGVCILFNSLSVFSPQDVNVLLSNIHNTLVDNGRLFIDIDNKKTNCNYGVYKTNWYLEPYKLLLQEIYFHQEISVEVCRDIYFDLDSDTFDEAVLFKRIYSISEIEQQIKSTGFTIESIYGNWNLDKFIIDSPKIIIIARKDS